MFKKKRKTEPSLIDTMPESFGNEEAEGLWDAVEELGEEPASSRSRASRSRQPERQGPAESSRTRSSRVRDDLEPWPDRLSAPRAGAVASGEPSRSTSQRRPASRDAKDRTASPESAARRQDAPRKASNGRKTEPKKSTKRTKAALPNGGTATVELRPSKDKNGRPRVVVVDVDIPLWRLIYLHMEFLTTFLVSLFLLACLVAASLWGIWKLLTAFGLVSSLESFMSQFL